MLELFEMDRLKKENYKLYDKIYELDNKIDELKSERDQMKIHLDYCNRFRLKRGD